MTRGLMSRLRIVPFAMSPLVIIVAAVAVPPPTISAVATQAAIVVLIVFPPEWPGAMQTNMLRAERNVNRVGARPA